MGAQNRVEEVTVKRGLEIGPKRPLSNGLKIGWRKQLSKRGSKSGGGSNCQTGAQNRVEEATVKRGLKIALRK